MSRATAVLVVAAFVFPLSGPVPTAQADMVRVDLPSATVRLHFSDPPKSGVGDSAAVDQLIRLVGQADRGATVRIAFHLLTIDEVTKAIVAAKNRGVTVRVLHDGSQKTSERWAVTQLTSKLGSNHKWCDHGKSSCISGHDSGLMHAKYMLIDKLTDSGGVAHQDVTWFSSANMTVPSGTRTFNNTVTVYDDSDLYGDVYREVWTPMWDEGRTHDYGVDYYDYATGTGYFHSSQTNFHGFVSPEQQTDPVKDMLFKVDAGPDCFIRVMQAQFTDGRQGIAGRLATLKADGCSITVAANRIDPGVCKALGDVNIPVKKNSRIHDKVIMINARYAGSSTPKQMVLAGSHNLTAPALRENDELLIRMNNAKIHKAYYVHYRKAYDSGAPGCG